MSLYGTCFVGFCTREPYRDSPPGGATLVEVSSKSPNPLLSTQFRVPFDRIQAADVEPAVAVLLREARERLETLANAPGDRTYENTMRELDVLTEPLDYAMSVVRHLEAVATYPELRAAFNAVQPEVSAFYTGIPLHQGLWKSIKAYAATGEAMSLTGARKRYVSKTMDTFRRHGADLDQAGKKRLEELDVELTQLTTKFSENVLDSTNAFELVLTEDADLAGLPPTALASARESAERKGKPGWRFTLQAPDYFAVMTYLAKAEIRRSLYDAYGVRATEAERDNRPLLTRILELRREKARLLGFRDFADLVLEDRMAHTGARALSFLEDLKAKTARRFAEENRELLEFRRSIEGADAPELAPWDIAYYSEKQRAAKYDFDEEALRPYFSLDRVVAGLFDLVNRLYGIQVDEEPGAPVWDPQVRYYRMRDEAGTFLGGFYADWYPRENKRGGAWMDSLITGGPAPDGFQPHLGLICGNLTPPIAGRPALLTHREVETIFHEFGHLLHHMLSRVEMKSMAGTNVAWDFVELPSQIMENWCWERPALDLFARHWETGEPIPADLFDKMKSARTFRAANAQMRQLGFGFVDLLLHVSYSPERDGEVVAYTRRLLQEFSPAPLPPQHAMIAAFTHLFGSPVGYGAGYYSYKWAEVLDADAFSRFREQGIFSREAGDAFRENILSKGDSEDPAELYRKFMGRDPDPNALLVRSGLA
jgi:oligopeptidase A